MIDNLLGYIKSFKILFVENNYDSKIQTMKMFENLFEEIDTSDDGNIALENLKIINMILFLVI